MSKEKHIDYAVQIQGVLSELFRGDRDYYIDELELLEGDNFTHFMHALANVVPTRFFNKLTRDSKNNLEFNHIANQLCFQYSSKVQ